MCDGAGGHELQTIMGYAKEELKERKEQNYIPKKQIKGVPNTTFST